MTPEDRTRELEVIGAEVRSCTKCRLHQGRTLAVPGEGHSDTEVVFVGEGPGFNEDQQGRPFVGAAGGLLTDLLRSVGWSRDEVFITNVVKCRPPSNRDPEPDEMAACRPYLERQLAVLDPALVVTLGRFSLGTFMPGSRIGEVHGTARAVDPATGAPDAKAFAMYHPAAAFRQAALKETLFADMAGIPEALIQSREERAARRAAAQGAAAEAMEDAAPIAAAVAPEAETAVEIEIAAAAAESDAAALIADVADAPAESVAEAVVEAAVQDDIAIEIVVAESVAVPIAEADPVAAESLPFGAVAVVAASHDAPPSDQLSLF